MEALPANEIRKIFPTLTPRFFHSREFDHFLSLWVYYGKFILSCGQKPFDIRILNDKFLYVLKRHKMVKRSKNGGKA